MTADADSTPDAGAPPADPSERWLMLLAGQVHDEHEQSATLAMGRSALVAALASESAEGDLVELVRRRLLPAQDTETWKGLVESLTAYLGDDAGYYLVGALRGGVFTDDVEAEPRVATLVARIEALFSTELQEAFALWLENPDDWRRVRWEIYLDQITGKTRIEWTVVAYSGRATTLVCDEDSLMRLATRIVATLSKVRIGSSLDPELIDEMRAEVDALESGLADALTDEAGGDGTGPAGREPADAP